MTSFTTAGGLLFVLTLLYWIVLGWLAVGRFGRGRGLLLAFALGPIAGFALAAVTQLVVYLVVR